MNLTGSDFPLPMDAAASVAPDTAAQQGGWEMPPADEPAEATPQPGEGAPGHIPSDSGSDTPSAGVIVGIALGVAAAVGTALGLAVLLARRRRRGRRGGAKTHTLGKVRWGLGR